MTITTNNKLNFGWQGPTHAEITRIALEDFPKLKGLESSFAKYAQMPDIDETGSYWIFGNQHYYGKRQKNALVNYNLHIQKMIEAAKIKDESNLVEHSARAMHFLQDMAQPQHLESRPLVLRVRDIISHYAFERFSREKQNIFLKPCEQNFEQPRDYSKIFMDNVEFSSAYKQPRFHNISSWERTCAEGLNKAVASSKEFLASLEKLF